MAILVSITIDNVIKALSDFIAPFLPDGTEIIRAQVNRVPSPLGSYVKLTEMHTTDLETPSLVYDTSIAQQLKISGPKQIDIQIDFYGESSGDWSNAFKTAYRTSYATSQFPDGIKPLFCSDGNQGPLVTGEEQYESRWTITASLQYNPAITVSAQSATALAINILEDVQ